MVSSLHRLLLVLSTLLVSATMFSLCGCSRVSGFVMNESGQGYYKRGHYALAQREFRKAIMDNPRNANYWYNYAAAAQKTGDWGGAEQFYYQALSLDPSHQPSYHGLASLMVDQGRGGEAEQLLSSWAGSQPYLVEPHIEMAWFQRQQGDLMGAEMSLQQALQVDPRSSRAIAQLGQVYEESGRGSDALGLYQQSLAMNGFQTEVRSRMIALEDRYPQQMQMQSGFGATSSPMLASGYPYPNGMPTGLSPNQMLGMNPGMSLSSGMTMHPGMSMNPGMAWSSPAPSPFGGSGVPAAPAQLTGFASHGAPHWGLPAPQPQSQGMFSPWAPSNMGGGRHPQLPAPPPAQWMANYPSRGPAPYPAAPLPSAPQPSAPRPQGHWGMGYHTSQPSPPRYSGYDMQQPAPIPSAPQPQQFPYQSVQTQPAPRPTVDYRAASYSQPAPQPGFTAMTAEYGEGVSVPLAGPARGQQHAPPAPNPILLPPMAEYDHTPDSTPAPRPYIPVEQIGYNEPASGSTGRLLVSPEPSTPGRFPESVPTVSAF